MGEILRVCAFYFIFFVVSLAHLGVKPLDRFWQVIPQNACFSVSCIPRGINIHKVSVFPHFCPKNTQKGARIGIFKLNIQNIKTCILSKLLHRFKPNFAQWQRPPKYTLWVVQTGIQQIQDGGRPPSWKIINGHTSATPWPICTKFGTVSHFGPPKGMVIRVWVT